MKARPTMRAKREIEQASHTFKDPGPPLPDGDWRPRVITKDPEAMWAAAFLKEGRDYSGHTVEAPPAKSLSPRRRPLMVAAE